MTTSRRGKPRPPAWTPQEDARLLALRQQGLTWDTIAAALPGRTVNACTARAYSLSERGASGIGKARSSDGVPSQERRSAIARALAARDAAAMAPRTLTAMICGDPLPGRSALDQGSRAAQADHACGETMSVGIGVQP